MARPFKGHLGIIEAVRSTMSRVETLDRAQAGDEERTWAKSLIDFAPSDIGEPAVVN